MPKVINGTYVIEQVIGGGGMSTVYKARHIRLGTEWAVKITGKNEQVGLLAESDILKKLNHPMIARIVDVFEDQNYLYIVEDLVHGETLQQVIDRQKVIPERQLIVWFKDLTEVLSYLHHQTPPIIYRDMKPSNVMLQQDGKLKLIDFGIAREYKTAKNADTSFVGTNGYAAPEQFGKAQSDARTDIYALGVTMHYLATGKNPLDPPYGCVPIRQLNPKCSAGLEIIIDKCTAMNPEDRYQNVEELRNDLNHIERFDTDYKTYKRKKRNRQIITRVLYGAGLLLIAGGILIIRNGRTTLYEEYIEQAENADYETSISLLKEAEELDAENVTAYTLEASIYNQYGEYQNTIDLVSDLETDGIVSSVSDPEIYSYLGSAYFEMGDYSNAVSIFQSIASSDSRLGITASLDYAASLARNGDLEGAEKVLNELSGEASSIQLDYMQGELASLKGEYVSAETQFLKVLEETEDEDFKRKTVIALAEAYRDSAKLDSDDTNRIVDAESKEIDLLNDAITNLNMERNTVAMDMLGDAYYRRAENGSSDTNADYKESLECFQKEKDLGIQTLQIYLNIYNLQYMLGDYDNAAKTLDEAEAAFPSEYRINVNRAYLMMKLQEGKIESERDYTEAVKEYQKAKAKADSTEDQSDLQQLASVMQDLVNKGWVSADAIAAIHGKESLC